MGTSMIYFLDIQIFMHIFNILKRVIMKQQKYKKSGNRGIFDEQDAYKKLPAIGNPLEMTSKVVNLEIIREAL
jgi:hypothetical protein